MDKPITLCDRCDIVMSCLLDYDGIPCRRNRTVEPTNADRIRAMSDEELAHFMAHYDSITEVGEQLAYERWLEWLKQEVNDGFN